MCKGCCRPKTFLKLRMLALVVITLLTTNLASAAMLAPKVAAVSSESPAGLDRDADHSVDGNGLTGGGRHLQGENGIAWTSVGSYGPTDYDPYIIYDLGAEYDVSMMRIWNYNSAFIVKAPEPAADKSPQELSTVKTRANGTTISIVGPDLVEVFTSVDGVTFTSQGTVHFAQASGTDDYAGQDIPVNYTGVRYIEFDILTNHDGAVFNGTGNKRGQIDGRALTGLSEVRFQVPDRIELRQPGGATVVHEGAAGDSYDIRLVRRPASGAAVQVKAVPSDPQIKLNDASAGMAVDLIFTQENWNQWQKVAVHATDDSIPDPGHISSIRHITTSQRDPAFNHCQIEDLPVRIMEDDKTDARSDAALEPIDPDKRMEWFRDAKYYWFIHWNPCSLAGTEISWSRGAVGKSKYDALYKEFNPTEFDGDEWVRIAKAAGFRTMVLTTKHHDGFCMWDTKQTDYNIMNTPYGKDIVKELADACKRNNFRFSIYYSVMDWYQPDWPHYFAGGPGYELPAGQKPNVDRYIAYMKNQITELLTNYGPIALLWWDGTDGRMQFAPTWSGKQAADLEAHTRALQPAIVMNNRVGHWDGHQLPPNWWVDEYGDYDSSEVGLSGFNMETPWEYTFTLGTQWAWKPNDSYKSTKTMIHYMVIIAGRDGNLLLNTSPPPTGKFEDAVVERLAEIGHWLKHNGQSYYGTRGGPYKPGTWGASTRKDNRIYLHILNWSGDPLVLPAIDKKITKSCVLTGGQVTVTQSENKVTIDVPEYYRRDIDTIVVLELDGPAMEIPPIDT